MSDWLVKAMLGCLSAAVANLYWMEHRRLASILWFISAAGWTVSAILMALYQRRRSREQDWTDWR